MLTTCSAWKYTHRYKLQQFQLLIL